MTTYVISYKYRRGGEMRLAEAHSVQDLLDWIRKEASRCVVVAIARMEE